MGVAFFTFIFYAPEDTYSLIPQIYDLTIGVLHAPLVYIRADLVHFINPCPIDILFVDHGSP
jgi:hypothetical protein